jgi:hypothetical protein
VGCLEASIEQRGTVWGLGTSKFGDARQERESFGKFCMRAAFTYYRNSKYFLFHPPHQIFKRMHKTLNVGKKKLIA